MMRLEIECRHGAHFWQIQVKIYIAADTKMTIMTIINMKLQFRRKLEL